MAKAARSLAITLAPSGYGNSGSGCSRHPAARLLVCTLFGTATVPEPVSSGAQEENINPNETRFVSHSDVSLAYTLTVIRRLNSE